MDRLLLAYAVFTSVFGYQVLVHGNATDAEAKTLAEDVRKSLRCAPLPAACATVRRGVMLQPGTEYVHAVSALAFNPNEQNSAIEMLLFTSRSPGAGDYASAGADGMIQLSNRLLTLASYCRCF